MIKDLAATLANYFKNLLDQLSGNNQALSILCGSIIIISCVGFASPTVRKLLMLDTVGAPRLRNLWQIVTYGLVHADLTHLMVNVISLGSFGAALLHLTNLRIAATVFLTSVVTPALLVTIIPNLRGKQQGFVGASCGITGLIGAVGYLRPDDKILIFFAWPTELHTALVCLIVISFGLHVTRTGTSVWHLGHAVGAISGFAYMAINY